MAIPLSSLIDDRPEEGVFRVNRAIFDDPDIFELEMRAHLRGRLGVPRPRRPGARAARLLHHSHRPRTGAGDARRRRDARRASSTPARTRARSLPRRSTAMRGFTSAPITAGRFDSAGGNKGIKWKQGRLLCRRPSTTTATTSRACPPSREYRGFLFGSLRRDVPPLADHLGEAAKLLDLDRRPERGGGGAGPGRRHLHLRRQLEAAARELLGRLSLHLGPSVLHPHSRAAAGGGRRLGGAVGLGE